MGSFFVVALFSVLFGVIAAFYYLKIIKIMYFDQQKEELNLKDIAFAKPSSLAFSKALSALSN